MEAHRIRIDCAGVGTNDICGMAVKRIVMLGFSVSNMKAPTVKMKTVTLIGKGR